MRLALLLSSYLILGESHALAEIKVDGTLGKESSIVTQGVDAQGQESSVVHIDGGAIRGANLFHSFNEFSIGNQQQVYFSNPTGIENILTRVTGNNPSNILGTLGVLGNGNLFLINPNGIIFGANARLDVAGSFVASTANSLRFDNDFNFSATNPQIPPLLTINVPLGLQFGTNPKPIQVQTLLMPGLLVPTGKTLALVGGDISLESAILQAAAGRIELGSVAGEGIVGVDDAGDRLKLTFPDTIPLANISLSQASLVNASGEGAGDIQVQGNQVFLTEGSSLVTNTLGAQPGGSLLINAASLDISGTDANGNSGGLFARTSGTGNAANVTINTNKLTVQQGARISTATSNQGRGGNLLVNASQSVDVIGTTGAGNRRSAFFVDSASTGDAGNLTINTGRLTLRDGSLFSVATRGNGKGGNLTVNASQKVELLGTTPNGFYSSSFDAYTLGAKDAGSVTINTGDFIVRDGASIFTATYGAGRGANITVNASNTVEVSGTGKVGNIVFPTGLLAETLPDATGNAGNIEINTRGLIVKNGGSISTSTESAGKAGNIIVNATQFVDVLGTSANSELASLVTTQVTTDGTGMGGDLQITTGRLNVRDGAQISTSTFGAGDSGKLTVKASESVEVSGILPNNQSASGLFSQVNSSGTGNAGELIIDTKRLIVEKGAEISASTRGAGNASNLIVNASKSVEVIGTSIDGTRISNLSARSLRSGTAGNLQINTPDLRIEDGAKVTVSASGSGKPGNLDVVTNSIFLNQGSIEAATAVGGGANIGLQVSELILMRNRSLINARAFNNGDGGNINIGTNFVAAAPNENSDIIANAFAGSGGRINITAQGIYGLQLSETLTPLSEINASSQLGINGIVEIKTPDVDPSRGIVNLPTNLVDAAKLVAQSCRNSGEATANQQSEFIVTGRGGLPVNPIEPLSSDAIWQDLQPHALLDENVSGSQKEVNLVSETQIAIAQAQGWVTNSDGTITLVAQAPTPTPYTSSLTPVSCPVAQN
ncbi:S-layer family protein [Nostoc sp. FACHB-152]|uniref:two-partner secretion domain-containing protein n=1 Tax=Nostoc sp. FACHB-152 TaxID=2692837 RepID=UPI001F552CE3|nr:S-layer family protein [Nostoc sp. FACHB-152]